jgi:hypothetical protein
MGFDISSRREKGAAEKYVKEEKKKFAILQEKIAMQKKVFEAIKGYKHPLIASGATTIGSARRAPDELTQK